MKTSWLMVLAFSSTWAIDVAASPILIDHGDYLEDTVSGLDWLDVTKSVNRTYGDVSSQFGAGGDFAGWRYATDLEFSALIENYTGVSVNLNTDTYFGGNQLDGLINMLGSTLDTTYLNYYGQTFTDYFNLDPAYSFKMTKGFFYDPNPYYYNKPFATLYDDDRLSNPNHFTSVHSSYDYAHYSIAPGHGIGSFLVRSAPEPATVILFGMALAGLGVSIRSNRSRSV